MARPSKLTPERQDKIIEALQVGATYDIAATYAGVTYETFNNWIKRGRTEYERLERSERAKPKETEAPFLEFFQAVTTANAEAAMVWLSTIYTAAQGDPQWALIMLERRFFEQYGARQRIESRDREGNPVETQITGVVQIYIPDNGRQ